MEHHEQHRDGRAEPVGRYIQVQGADQHPREPEEDLPAEPADPGRGDTAEQGSRRHRRPLRGCHDHYGREDGHHQQEQRFSCPQQAARSRPQHLWAAHALHGHLAERQRENR